LFIKINRKEEKMSLEKAKGEIGEIVCEMCQFESTGCDPLKCETLNEVDRVLEEFEKSCKKED